VHGGQVVNIACSVWPGITLRLNQHIKIQIHGKRFMASVSESCRVLSKVVEKNGRGLSNEMMMVA